MKATLSFKAQGFAVRPIKDFLAKLKFVGWNIEYLTTGNWIETEFIIKAEPDVLAKIQEALKKWDSE